MIAFLKKAWSNQFVRYTAVGFGRWLLGTAIMFLLYNCCGCGYWFSSFCNEFLTNFVLGYFLGYLIVFPDQRFQWKAMLEFGLLVVTVYLIAYSLAPLVVKPAETVIADWVSARFGIRYGRLLRGNITLCVGMVLHMGLNYLGQRFFVFARRNRKAE